LGSGLQRSMTTGSRLGTRSDWAGSFIAWEGGLWSSGLEQRSMSYNTISTSILGNRVGHSRLIEDVEISESDEIVVIDFWWRR
jgi:hypothetical protein